MIFKKNLKRKNAHYNVAKHKILPGGGGGGGECGRIAPLFLLSLEEFCWLAAEEGRGGSGKGGAPRGGPLRSLAGDAESAYTEFESICEALYTEKKKMN